MNVLPAIEWNAKHGAIGVSLLDKSCTEDQWEGPAKRGVPISAERVADLLG